MSGFEIAGVVLGIIPIVVEALSTYRDGKGLLAIIRKSHILVDELIHKLRTQRVHFYLDILELLREAEVPEILTEGDPTPDRCIEILQAVKTGIEIEQYLGPQLFRNFLEIIGFYETYLKKIISKLDHIIRPQNASQFKLLHLRKLKFAIDKESLCALVKDLENERYSLGKLIRRAKTKREWETSEPTSSSATLTLAFSCVRECAISVYRAACKCLVCDRHQLHTLMIGLEHRIPKKNDRTASPSAISFRLCFPIEEVMLQKIEIRTQHSDSFTSKTPIAFDGGHKIPSIAVTQTPNVCYPTAAQVLVSNLCEEAQKARERRRVLSLELTSSTILEVAEKDDNSPHSYDKSISLADFLKDTAADADAHMSPIEQTLLALNIVSSVLQLWPTVWCSQPWNSTIIKFPVQVVDGARAAFCTPYIEQTIDSTILGMQGGLFVDPTTESAKATMLELAIMLLEILHHKSIAAWAAQYDKSIPRTYWERMGTATRWLEWSTSKLLPPHVKAVEECLMFCARSKLSWDNCFQQLYCENIIKPLQELIL
ncbi:hypothetical protein HJFPF1_12419 [Paramyrothecium foliicola]|nr:hypothetical protein HJFPF1_12419 [Paramyrothecium foliicola]